MSQVRTIIDDMMDHLEDLRAERDGYFATIDAARRDLFIASDQMRSICRAMTPHTTPALFMLHDAAERAGLQVA